MSQYQSQNRKYNFVKRKSDAPHSYNIQAKLQNGVLSIFVHDTMTNKQWRQEFTQVSFPSHKLYHVAKSLIAAIQEMVKVTQQKHYATLHYPNGVKPIAILVYNKWCYLTIHGSKLPSFALRPVDQQSRYNNNNQRTNNNNNTNKNRNKNKSNNNKVTSTRSSSPRAFSPRSVAPQSIPPGRNSNNNNKNKNKNKNKNNNSRSNSHSTSTSAHSPRAFSPRSVAPREPGLKASKTDDAKQIVIKIETTRKVQHFPPLPHPPARTRSNSNSNSNQLTKLIVLSNCKSHSATNSISSAKSCGVAPTRPLPALPNKNHKYSRSMGNLTKKDSKGNNSNTTRVVTPMPFKDLKSLKRNPPMSKMVHGNSMKSASLSMANSVDSKSTTVQTNSMYSQQSLNSITECSAMDRQSSSSSASSFDSEIITTDTSNYGSFESLMGSDSDSHLGSLDSLMTYSGSNSSSNNLSRFNAVNSRNNNNNNYNNKRQNNMYHNHNNMGMDDDDDESDEYDPSCFEREYFNLERGNVQCRERSNQLDPIRQHNRDIINNSNNRHAAGQRRLGTVYGKNDSNNSRNNLCVGLGVGNMGMGMVMGENRNAMNNNNNNNNNNNSRNVPKNGRKSKNGKNKKKKRKNSKGKRYEKWNNFTLAVNGDVVTDLYSFMERQALAEEAYYDEEEEMPYYDPNFLGLSPEYDD